MKTLLRTATLATAVLLTAAPAFGLDPAAFPGSGLDAQSLGRGGTVIASPPGVWSVFGNPATLTDEGGYILGVDYLDRRGVSKKSWGLSIVDTSSNIRGALSYYIDPEFAGFKEKMWGISLSQTLLPSLYIGESFHMGEYEPTASPGGSRSLHTVDAGLLFRMGPKVSIGYVVHNLLPSDKDLLDPYSGFGIGLRLLKTVNLSADYEEDPENPSDVNLRAGMEFFPFKKVTGRLGYQDRADGTKGLSLGITYTDINGTLDAAVLYNDTEDRTELVVLGLSIRM